MVSNKGGLDIHHSGEAMPTTEERLRDLRNRKAQSEAGGGQIRVDAQHNRGKLTARKGLKSCSMKAAFQEIDALVEHRHEILTWIRMSSGDGVVTGHGCINGRKVFALLRILRSTVGHWAGHGLKICKALTWH